MQESKQLHWYDSLPFLPILIILVPSLFVLFHDPFGRITLNFLFFSWNFQALTIALTSVLFITVYLLLIHKMKFMDRIILTVATSVLATHFYEMIHALFQLYSTGFTGMTLWILNIPVVVWLSLFLFFYGRKHKVLYINLWVVILFSSFFVSFLNLYTTGFFYDIDTKRLWWASSKITCYVMWIPFFIGGRKK